VRGADGLSSEVPVTPDKQDTGSEWIATARTLLEGLSTSEQGIEAALGRREISTADAPAIDSLIVRVEHGFAWLEQIHTTMHREASTELRAALGVLRNLAFAARRLSIGEDNPALRTTCGALIEQSRLHIQAAARAIDQSMRHSS
jgi:hypothetical protein